jgi:transcriptional regulator with GAF, ATPase, and Fis domain
MSKRDPQPSSFTDATEPLARHSERPAPIGAVVRVEGAEAQPQRLELGVGSCVVGSAPGCDIVIADRAVSRQHLELGLLAEGVSVRDLGSRNGTFFHGQRLEKMVLGLGAKLEIGEVTVHLEADAQALHEAPVFEGGAYRGIVGASPAMRQLFAVLARLEGSLATVLVEGESGVGKERVAQALHHGSKVSEGPLVAVNCGAFPRELVASELFGHKKGAFSGAFDARKGAFESADGGTLFLDEVGELPLELQPMLLRAIELGEVRALGEDRPKQVRVRIIAATNRDLEQDVHAGKFRHDLFYRLAVVRLQVPPLRERPEDIGPLAQHFAETAGIEPLEAAALGELKSRRWPGNARELRNAVVAFAALGTLPRRPQAPPADVERLVTQLVDLERPFAEQKEALTDAFARVYLQALLERTGGNQSEAARVSGLNRSYLGRMLQKYGLNKS